MLLQMAFKYLGMVLFPLFVGYGVYSLFYLEHKGWYSFALGMSYGFLLTFGECHCHNASTIYSLAVTIAGSKLEL